MLKLTLPGWRKGDGGLGGEGEGVPEVSLRRPWSMCSLLFCSLSEIPLQEGRGEADVLLSGDASGQVAVKGRMSLEMTGFVGEKFGYDGN